MIKDYTMFKIADIISKSQTFRIGKFCTYPIGNNASFDFTLCKIELLLMEDHGSLDLLI